MEVKIKPKLKLVFIDAPIPFGGAASRWYYTLTSGLIESEYDVEIFASCANEKQMEEARKLFPKGHFYLYSKEVGYLKKIRTILKPSSYSIPKEMKSDFNKSLKDHYDLIHIEQTFASWILDEVNEKCLLSVHYLSAIDLKDIKLPTLKDKLIITLMKKAEKRLIGRFSNIKSCSDRIENNIKQWYPDKKYSHFPFGIDYSQYNYLEDLDRAPSTYITLIASMGWYPGKSAALRLLNQIWPVLKSRNSSMKLRIVGWDARKVLKDYLFLENVEILENVPDIKKYFYESALLIYTPSQGSGVKIKIQEAMLLGTPVVTNADGVEGLKAEAGVHALVAETDEDIIKSTEILFNNLILQNKLRKNARDLIISTCNGEVTVSLMKKMYSEILSRTL